MPGDHLCHRRPIHLAIQVPSRGSRHRGHLPPFPAGCDRCWRSAASGGVASGRRESRVPGGAPRRGITRWIGLTRWIRYPPGASIHRISRIHRVNPAAPPGCRCWSDQPGRDRPFPGDDVPSSWFGQSKSIMNSVTRAGGRRRRRDRRRSAGRPLGCRWGRRGPGWPGRPLASAPSATERNPRCRLRSVAVYPGLAALTLTGVYLSSFAYIAVIMLRALLDDG